MTSPNDLQGDDPGRTPILDNPWAQVPSRLNSLSYWPVWFGMRMAMKIWFRVRIENAPKLAGGYVLAANHTSFLDPILLGSAAPRRVTFLMTEVVYRSPLLGWFYRWSRSIPLAARGGNRLALRAARWALAQGRVLGIYPEGGLSRDGGLMLGSPGAVSLVFNEAVPIIPVGIIGAWEALPAGRAFPLPRRITIRFGAPISHEEMTSLAPGEDRKARLQAATRLIMERIATLTGATPREQEIATLRAAMRD
ncbi:MAG: lysophospholipid acyltransferase family protein [Planctomycetota bacterium]|nr:lysophospholipid acyltransferase family protein [Planctomycetota bacterium]MSR39941.1 1-acyl-sn-glycerol-3-phosphate acyltransferase [Planctomycetota bacterium]